jgi:flagellar hook-associated protein 3 FlgL
MRVTQSETYRNFLSDIGTLNESLNNASRQVSSGKKLNQLKDSPEGCAELVSLNTQASEIDQYQSNIDTGSYFLGVADSVLNEVNNLVTSIYTLGSQAASDLASPDTRATLATEIRSLRDQILSIANTCVRGRYIFAGSEVTTAPFVLQGDSVSYQGDSNVNSIAVDDGIAVQEGVSGSSTFNSIFASIDSLLTAMGGNDTSSIGTALGQFSSALSELGQARGQIGSNLSLLQNVKTNLDSKGTNLKGRQSAIEDADMAVAAVQLSQTQTALQTAISAGGIILQQRNLFDILG